MAKEKKQFKLHSIKLEQEVSDKLEEYCSATGATKTAVIERGIVYYIELMEGLQRLNSDPVLRQKHAPVIRALEEQERQKQDMNKRGGKNEN